MAAKHTSIKKNVALSFVRVAALLVTMIFIVIALVFFPKIWKFERDDVEQDLLRAIEALEQEITTLEAHADDWAYWDDTYHYLENQNQTYKKSNLNYASLHDANLDFISLLSPDGNILWSQYLKGGSSYSGAPTDSGEWPKPFLAELNKHPEGMSGYFLSELGALCFAARPVLTTERQGPSRGWFITGRWLKKSFTARVKQLIQVPLTFQLHNPAEKEVFNRYLKAKVPFYIESLSLSEIKAKAVILDYKNEPVFTLSFNKKREILADFSQAMLIVLFGLVLAGTFCTWFLYRRVQKVILDPLSNLTKSMEHLGNKKSLPLITNHNHSDEISLLYQKYYEVTAELLKAQKALEKRSSLLEIETLTDPLTKLHNRRYLERLIPAIIDNIAPNEQKLLLVIDIDFFKAMNDQFGHAAGDEILIQLALLLKSIFQDNDHIIRMGGEEFLVITNSRGSKKNKELAEQVRRYVEEYTFTTCQNQQLNVTVSIGFSWFPLNKSAKPAACWQKSLQLADYALYQAKFSGRNSWCGYHTAPSITDEQLAMIPDHIEELVEAKIIQPLRAGSA